MPVPTVRRSAALAALLLAASQPARAQSAPSPGFSQGSLQGSAQGSADILPTLTAEFFQDLSFGTIAPSTTQASTVWVLRGTNNSSVCGAGLVCFRSGNRARIRISGAPGQRFSISDPGSTILTDDVGNTMRVDTFVGGGSGNDSRYGRIVRLRSNGRSTLNIGATLHVAANQPAGRYSGTYTVTASYE